MGRLRIQPGVSSFAFGWAVGHGGFDERALLAFARQHAVPVVQVADNMPVHTWPADRLDHFVREARASGIAVELGARGLTDEHLARYLDLCRQCGARLLRFVADAHLYEPSPGDLVALLQNGLAALEQAGVVLALENHDRFPAATLRRIVEAAGSAHVGVRLDTANSLGAGEGLEAVTEILAPVTVNLHVKDVRITRLPHMMGFVVHGAALGEGQLPLRQTIERVAGHGRCGTAILEGGPPRSIRTWRPPSLGKLPPRYRASNGSRSGSRSGDRAGSGAQRSGGKQLRLCSHTPASSRRSRSEAEQRDHRTMCDQNGAGCDALPIHAVRAEAGTAAGPCRSLPDELRFHGGTIG